MFGGFTYTEDLSGFVERVLRLLEVGGDFYTLVPGVHLEGGDKLGVLYLTELENAAGRPEKVCSWLKQDLLRASHLRVEERLEKAHRADKSREGLQRCLCPAHEISGVRGGISSRPAISIGPVG